MTAAIVIAAVVVFIIGLFAVIVERTEQRDEALALAAEAHVTAAHAVEQAETFADELTAERKRSKDAEKAVVRLVGEKLRLSNDLMRAQMLASDAREELAAEPAPVIPLPRRGSHDDLAALDAEATAYTWPSIARDAFPVREWGEEAEK
jgi:hypothetical protein